MKCCWVPPGNLWGRYMRQNRNLTKGFNISVAVLYHWKYTMKIKDGGNTNEGHRVF